jgi:hypothetical protein
VSLSLVEIRRTEMFWASFTFIPLLFLASLVWLGIAALQFIIAKRQEAHSKSNN